MKCNMLMNVQPKIYKHCRHAFLLYMMTKILITVSD